MIIAFDFRKVNDGGIGRYIKNTLFSYIETYAENRYLIICFTEQIDEIKILMKKKWAKYDNIEFIKTKCRLYSFKELFFMGIELNKYKFDVFHTPHYVLPFFIKSKKVVTIHDLIHLKFSNYLPSRIAYYYAKFNIWHSLRCADKVITVSRTSRDDIIRHFPKYRQKIIVIYNVLQKKHYNREYKSGNFLMYVGNLKAHKNVKYLIDLIVKIRYLTSAIQLRIFTQDENISDISDYINTNSANSFIKIFRNMSDDSIKNNYCRCRGYITTAKYEGFGLPPVEAAMKKRPVFAPNIPIFKEILSVKSCFINLNDCEESARKIFLLLNNKIKLKEMISKNYNKVVRYCDNNLIKKVAAVYNSLK